MGHFLNAIDPLPEAALNVFCSRAERSGTVPALCDEDGWKRTLEYAQVHGVLQFLAAATSRGEIEAPEAWGEILAIQQQRNAVRAIVQHRECQRVLDALSAAAIAAVAFKGTSLSKLLYGRVADRTSTDIDILISAAHLPDAQNVLQSLDYVPADAVARVKWDDLDRSGNEMAFVNDIGVVVELHWRLFETDRMGAFPIALEQLNTVGHQIANEDLFLVLALHGLAHRWEALKWVVDIDAFVRNVATDWDTVLRRAADSGTTRAARIALLLAHGIFDTKLPASFVDRTAERLARRYARGLLTAERIPPVLDFWMQIAARERWVDRVRFVRFVMHPKPWDLHGGRFKMFFRFSRLLSQSLRRSTISEAQKIPELRGPQARENHVRH